MEARIPFGDEPKTPRWVEWRLAVYPLALLVGALAVAAPDPALRVLLFSVFVVAMLAPLAVKVMAWGGLRRTISWLFRRRIQVTKEGYFFLGLTILFGVAAINTGTNLLYLILSMLLALIVVSGVVSEINIRGLRLSRSIPREVFAGEPARFAVSIQNPRRWVPSFAIDAREIEGPFGPGGTRAEGPGGFFPRIEAGERRTVRITATVPRRGVYELTGFVLTTGFPFGFFIKFARASLTRELVVYPRSRPVRAGALPALGSVEERARVAARSFSPDEFRSLRPYRAGDNPRFIHWRSSARLGGLLVKEFEAVATRRAAVVLDSDPAGLAIRPVRVHEPAPAVLALDRGAVLCASVTEHLSRLGERPEVAIAAGETVTRFGHEGGARMGRALLDALARLEPADDPDLLRVSEAARPALRDGAAVFVLSARPEAQVRRALEREDPGAAFRVRVLSFRDPADIERLLELEAGEDARPGPTPSAREAPARPAGEPLAAAAEG